jgi:acetoacetyl-CoA synthetase
VVDVLAVEVRADEVETRLLVFVVLGDGRELDEELTREIRRVVREQCSPRHAPDKVRQVPEIPRTLSGKIVEVPIKRILEGTPVEQAVSLDSLANPEALRYFVPGPTTEA